MNTPLPESELSAIKAELFGGRKITAIKVYRKYTNSGLLEAKEAIEKLEAELRAASPEKFTAAPAGKGCSTAIFVLGMILVAVLVMLWRV